MLILILISLFQLAGVGQSKIVPRFVSVDELVRQIMHNQSSRVTGDQTADTSWHGDNRSLGCVSRYQLNLISFFPPDFMPPEVRLSGGLLLHLLLFLYLCLALPVLI